MCIVFIGKQEKRREVFRDSTCIVLLHWMIYCVKEMFCISLSLVKMQLHCVVYIIIYHYFFNVYVLGKLYEILFLGTGQKRNYVEM